MQWYLEHGKLRNIYWKGSGRCQISRFFKNYPSDGHHVAVIAQLPAVALCFFLVMTKLLSAIKTGGRMNWDRKWLALRWVMSRKQGLRHHDLLALTKPVGSNPGTVQIQLVPDLQLSQKVNLSATPIATRPSTQNCNVNVLLILSYQMWHLTADGLYRSQCSTSLKLV